MKHTPESWYGNNGNKFHGLIYEEKSGKNIAVCYDKTHTNLIAAAPKLYTALKNWQQFMKDNYNPEDISWWNDTENAINRVEEGG